MVGPDPLTRLSQALASALTEFAETSQSGPASEADEASMPGRPPKPSDEHALGRRQQQIVEIPDLAAIAGMKTADIAAAIQYEVPNTYTALQALARSGVVERVPGKEPQHWRLARRYRAGSQAFGQAVTTLRTGEWTTPGDVSIAVRGDVQAASAVGKADLSIRVLTGEPVDGADLRAQLADDGVTLLDDHRPDPLQRVTWDELTRRITAAVTRRRTMTRAILNYLQIPADDLDDSSAFYENVFGWEITRYPSPGQTADQTGYVGFTDSSGHNGGEFVVGRPPSRDPGLLPCIAVDSIDDTLAGVVSNGGEVVRPRTAIVAGKDWEATFRDPAGNVLALFEEASTG